MALIKIEALLGENEKILWKKVEVKNYLYRIPIAFTLLGLLVVLIALFFWYVPSWEGHFYDPIFHIEIPPIFIYISILSIFYGATIFAVIIAIIEMKKGLKKNNAKLKDLINYEKASVLTTKRWFKKDAMSRFLINEASYKEEILEFENDIVIVYLNSIQKFFAHKHRMHYTISLYVNDVAINFKIKNDDFNQIITILREILDINGEEPQKEGTMYYCNVREVSDLPK